MPQPRPRIGERSGLNDGDQSGTPRTHHDGRGPRSGVKTIQAELEDLTSGGLPSFEQGQVIRVENDHRCSFFRGGFGRNDSRH